ncbi:MAG: thiamine pyrophosphate-binding protein [Thermomicrobiales bacterium]
MQSDPPQGPLLRHPAWVFQQLTVGWTVLDDPDDARREIDRVLARASATAGPVYIELPRDMVDAEIEIDG